MDDGPRPKLRLRLRSAFFSTRWQISLAVVTGLLLAAVPAIANGDRVYTHLADRGDYIAFLLGIASILALVASITFGFLLHHMQSVTAERYLLYNRFKDDVKELREFLDGLHAEGAIDGDYEFNFGLIDDVRLAQIPILDWSDRLAPLVEWVEEQKGLIADEDFGRLLRGFVYRGSDIEELVGGLTINWLKQSTANVMLEPVIKSFATLGAVILAIILAAAVYGGVLVTVLWGVVLALAAMTFLLVTEIGWIAWRQTQEVMEARELARALAGEFDADDVEPALEAPPAPDAA